jgi:hypothetical protein
MMTIRLARQDDREAWNRIARESAYGTYAHTWEWKETLERGFQARSLCLLAEQDGNVVGTYSGYLWPRFSRSGRFVRLKTTLLGSTRVLWSPFCQTWDYGGPCLVNEDPDVQGSLVVQMERLAKWRGVTDIWVSPFRDPFFQEQLRSRGYDSIPRFTALIDLTQSEDELWKKLKGETRSQIRQGQRFGLEATEDTTREGLDAFYECVRSVADRTAMTLPPRLFFDVLFETLVPAGMARIYTVRKEGETLGSALFLYYKKVLVARYWAAFQETLKLRPYHVLIWHILTEAKRLGYHTCDFGGMPPDETSGIYKFKKGWGVKIVNVDWFVKPVGLGQPMALAKNALSRFTRSNGALARA